MRKQITVTREVKTVSDDSSDEKTAGSMLGTIAAYIIAALVTLIVVGGLVWVAEAIWRAVL